LGARPRLSSDPKRRPQSRFVRYDPAKGRLTGASGVFLGVELAAVADDGKVADDTTKPTASIRGRVLRRHVSHRFSYYGPLGVKLGEPGQAIGELLLGGKNVGFGLASSDVAGLVDMQFTPRRASARLCAGRPPPTAARSCA
jgi:hypothetical protein